MTTQRTALPMTVEELVDWLDNIYPEHTPSRSDSEKDIWIAVGRREVVRHLLTLRDRQAEDDMLAE